jgi:signal transduction histidine kinase
MVTVRPQPLARQLLVPLILLGAALAALTLFAGWRQMNHQLDTQLVERARTIARALQFAAESTDSRESLSRLVRTFVAGGDVELVGISGGRPPRLISVSRPQMQGVMVDQLAAGGFDPDAVIVLSGDRHGEFSRRLPARGRFVYACRLNANLPATHPLARGGLLIELPTRALQQQITRSTWWNIAGVLLLGTAGAAGFAWLLRAHVLRPLAASLEREREAGRLKVNFLGMISHEFRNTLGLVLSSTQILARYGERLDAAARAQHLAKIEASCRRLSAVVEDTLFYSRSEGGRIELHLEPVDLAAFCLAEMRAAEPAAADGAGGRIRFVTTPGAPAGVTTDASLLRHVLGNLLSNALKYSGATSPVELSIGAAGPDRYFLAVSDRGIGIPADEQARLGEPFWRGRNTGNVHGTGLGLVIVRRCLDLLGGRLDCTSGPETGTRLTANLPLNPGKE